MLKRPQMSVLICSFTVQTFHFYNDFTVLEPRRGHKPRGGRPAVSVYSAPTDPHSGPNRSEPGEEGEKGAGRYQGQCAGDPGLDTGVGPGGGLQILVLSPLEVVFRY